MASVVMCSQSRPDVPEQTAQNFPAFISEKESDRIPFRLSGDRHVMMVDHPLHHVAQIGGRIRVENDGGVGHKA